MELKKIPAIENTKAALSKEQQAVLEKQQTVIPTESVEEKNSAITTINNDIEAHKAKKVEDVGQSQETGNVFSIAPKPKKENGFSRVAKLGGKIAAAALLAFTSMKSDAKDNNSSDHGKGGLHAYHAKTAKGRITTTGKANDLDSADIYNNTDSLYSIARQYNIDSTNDAVFQKGLFSKVAKQYPSILDAAFEKFGITQKGIDAGLTNEYFKKLKATNFADYIKAVEEDFEDGDNGARTTWTIRQIVKTDHEIPPPNVSETKPHPKPFEGWAKSTESLFGTNEHRIGDLWYPTIATHSHKDAGVLTKGPLVVRITNDFGYTGKAVFIEDASKLPGMLGNSTTDTFTSNTAQNSFVGGAVDEAVALAQYEAATRK